MSTRKNITYINFFNKKNLFKSIFSRKILQKYFSLIFLFFLFIFFTSQSSRFLTFRNIGNIFQQSAVLIIVAMGSTFVITAASIDLSTGAIVRISSVVTAGLIKSVGLLAIPFGISIGLLCGLINGFTYAKLKIPSFIATLGMMIAAKGLVLVYTRGMPIAIFYEKFLILGQGRTYNIPNIIFIALATLIFSWIIYNYTIFGRSILAIGGGEQVAKLSGINVDKLKVMLYTFAGGFSGLGGVVMASRVGGGTPLIAEGLELDVIASVVLGGTPLTGGIGSVQGTIIGALIMITLGNGLNLIGVSSYIQMIIKGIVLVLAVAITIDRDKIGIIK